MIPSNMLELQKLVLESVHENTTLFEKELLKSFHFLGYEDLQNLYYWAISKFSNQYGKLINYTFEGLLVSEQY
jgi:hypothetical protein